MNERRTHILELVTESYIRSAHPVPSSWVAEQLEVSSATVRNEFSALEHEGYLQQPHTSAGRVPTMLSYTRYARKFIPPKRLPFGQRKLLEERLRGAHGDSLLQQIANVTAELSGYAVVVSLPADDALHMLKVHLSVLSSSRLLAVVVLENGLIRQLVLELEPIPSDSSLREAESSLHGLALPVKEVPLALLDIARRTQDEVSRTFDALAQAWPTMNPPRLFSQGLKNLLTEPESADPNFMRRAVERVEQPPSSEHNADSEEALVIIFEEVLAQIGARLSFGRGRGGLVLLGPMRMRYPDALMVVHGVSEAVGARLDEAQLN